jgi:hypothetical protein
MGKFIIKFTYIKYYYSESKRKKKKEKRKKKKKEKKKKLFGCGILCVREIEIIRGPFYALFSGRFGKCGQCVSNVGNVANVGAADLID